MKFAMLGAGAFGTALGGILADNGYDIDYYDSKVERERLSDVLVNAKVIVLCVPSKAVPYLLPYLPKNIPMVVATKGILSDKCFADFKDWMVLSGPGFADDIKARKETYLTVTDERVKKWFEAPYLHFDLTSDKTGVLMCGALKNVYAIMAGYRGLMRDTTEWWQYITEVAGEMQALCSANGADGRTVDFACGKGDLELTCGLPSRNYEFGMKLRKNPDYMPEKTVEGLSTLKRIKRHEIVVPDKIKVLKEIMDGIKY